MSGTVVITGVGVVSPAGVGRQAMARAVFAGEGLIADLEAPWAAAPYQLAAAVKDLGARERIPAQRLRRMGRLARMAVVAALEAMDQSGAGAEDTGVVVGTGLGALEETVSLLEQLLQVGPVGANPALFPASVMNIAAAHISMELGLHGYNTTVNHKEISAEMAMLVAANAITRGHVRRILVTGVDELGPAAHHGYRRLRVLAPGRARPYRLGRDGMVLGEGATVLALEEVESVRQRGKPILARVIGLGAAAGERPLSDWGPSLEGGRCLGPAEEAGVAAVQQALDEAGVKPAEIDLVVGCGCGIPALDRLEARVLRSVFGSRPVPLSSPHGALGSYMAAGTLRLACAVEVLQQGRIFPTVTDGDPDPEVPVPGLVLEPRDYRANVVLACSHATGGGSAAVVLSRGDA